MQGIKRAFASLVVRASTVLDIVTQSVAVPMLHASTVIARDANAMTATGSTGKILVGPGYYRCHWRARASCTGTARIGIGKSATAAASIATIIDDSVDEVASNPSAALMSGMAIVQVTIPETFLQLLVSNEGGTGDVTLTKAEFIVEELIGREPRPGTILDA